MVYSHKYVYAQVYVCTCMNIYTCLVFQWYLFIYNIHTYKPVLEKVRLEMFVEMQSKSSMFKARFSFQISRLERNLS